MRFEKGRSGNPGGRPKGDGEIRDLARQHTLTALQALVEIASNGENESARVAAANALLDRAWGKPAVPIVTDDVPTIITFNLGGARSMPEANQVSEASYSATTGMPLMLGDKG